MSTFKWSSGTSFAPLAKAPVKKKSIFGSSVVSKAIAEAKEIQSKPVAVVPYALLVNQYPTLCGARIITSFPSVKGYEERVELALKNTIASHMKGFQYHVSLKVAGQVPANEGVLKKLGFREFARFHNPNSGNNIVNYIFDGQASTAKA